MPRPLKTYLLSPSFDFPPSGPLQLGNLLADPFRPHRPLARLPESAFPPLTTTTQLDRTLSRSAALDTSLSAGASVLSLLGAHARVGVARDASAEYTMTALRTSFFSADPAAEAMGELLRADRVQAAMGPVLWSRPLFLVTGVKIAEGLTLQSSRAVRRSVGAGVSGVPVSAEVNVDADVAVADERTAGEGFRAAQDVVLAYQLLKITLKGWRERKLRFDEYRSSSALLGAEKMEGVDLAAGIEAEGATKADFADADGKMVLDEAVGNEADDAPICIVFARE